MSRGTFFKNTHALVAACNHYGAAAEMRQQSAASFHKGFFVAERAGDEKSRFLGIANNRARAAISIQPRSFWLYKNRHAEL